MTTNMVKRNWRYFLKISFLFNSAFPYNALKNTILPKIVVCYCMITMRSLTNWKSAMNLISKVFLWTDLSHDDKMIGPSIIISIYLTIRKTYGSIITFISSSSTHIFLRIYYDSESPLTNTSLVHREYLILRRAFT